MASPATPTDRSNLLTPAGWQRAHSGATGEPARAARAMLNALSAGALSESALRSACVRFGLNADAIEGGFDVLAERGLIETTADGRFVRASASGPRVDPTPAQEQSDAEQVRKIGRFYFGAYRLPLTVATVSGGVVTFERARNERIRRTARVCDVLKDGGAFRPAPLGTAVSL